MSLSEQPSARPTALTSGSFSGSHQATRFEPVGSYPKEWVGFEARAASRRQTTTPCGFGTSPRANACASWGDIPLPSLTLRRFPTGAPSRRHTTAPCGFGTSPPGNACASWRDFPVASVMSRRCPMGARSWCQGTAR